MVGFLNLLVILVIVAAVVALLWYGFKQLPLPPIAQNIAIAVVCVLAAIFLISFLTGSMQFPVLIKG
jgi:hypothetical protein